MCWFSFKYKAAEGVGCYGEEKKKKKQSNTDFHTTRRREKQWKEPQPQQANITTSQQDLLL